MLDRKQIIKEHKNDTVEEFREYLKGVCWKGGTCTTKKTDYRCENCLLTKHLFKLIQLEREKHVCYNCVQASTCPGFMNQDYCIIDGEPVKTVDRPTVKHITKLSMRNPLTNPFYKQGRF